MAVYTEVTHTQAAQQLSTLQLGELHTLTACNGGIENTNYFASSSAGEFVLTIFERLEFTQLPFYLHLMQHLAERDVLVPKPIQDANGVVLHTMNNKPSCVVTKLEGKSELNPTANHCQQVGAQMAKMHLAAHDYPLKQPNLRGLDWWNKTASTVMPHLNSAQKKLLQEELAFQNTCYTSSAHELLPKGVIHADLFRDNVMFNHGILTGFFDFYFAGVDALLFDVAVVLNDWCVTHTNNNASGQPILELENAVLNAYAQIRPFTNEERALLPAVLRAAALRFWLSRLWDWHLPRAASVLQPHDPSHFERILTLRVQAMQPSE